MANRTHSLSSWPHIILPSIFWASVPLMAMHPSIGLQITLCGYWKLLVAQRSQ